MKQTGNTTLLLQRWRDGDRAAFDALVASLHPLLHEAAVAQLGRVRGQHTLRPTALVNEAYLQLMAQTGASWLNRDHFMAVAATAMRHILVNYLRAQRARKRGGDWLRVTLEDGAVMRDPRAEHLLAVDEALDVLSASHPRLAQVVELRVFGGLTESDVARALGLTERTVRRDWRKAKALLSVAMRGGRAAA